MNLHEYEETGSAKYERLAKRIASLVSDAIKAVEGYRLLQVTHRAKELVSLQRKVSDRGILETANLAEEIKDLAGCRVIFYTNDDVTRFVNSGIINELFDIVEIKIHQPRRDAEDATELYRSNHYLVRLKEELLSQPGFEEFDGMKCEIQIHTILNHAWAEMAHDTIYKSPDIGEFGAARLDEIKKRLRKVSDKYLIPAGYEFQKIARDYNHLMEGKKAFDDDLITEIIDAPDNNARQELIERFSEHVLSNYGDIRSIYPEVVEKLLVAAERARATAPVAIDTPIGEFDGKSPDDVIGEIVGVFSRCRYVDVDATFDAACQLYLNAETDEQKQLAIGLAEKLAKHDIDAWQRVGPLIQTNMIDRIGALSIAERHAMAPLVHTIIEAVLSSEITGTSSTSSTVMFRRRTVLVSEPLRSARNTAIELLKEQFTAAANDNERQLLIQALETASHQPTSVQYGNDLIKMIMEDTCTVLEMYREIASVLGLDLLQELEYKVQRHFWKFDELPDDMQNDPDIIALRDRIAELAKAFQTEVNADEEFVIYKVLVGIDPVFPPAWEDRNFIFDHNREQTYRKARAEELLQSVNSENAEEWFDRLCRFAAIKSIDGATFIEMMSFLEKLAAMQPGIVNGFIIRDAEVMRKFVPAMLVGLYSGDGRAQASQTIETWLATAHNINEIAKFLRITNDFDEDLLVRSLECAIKIGDVHAVKIVLYASANQFTETSKTLIDRVFLPALRHLQQIGDLSWVQFGWVSWLRKPIIEALDEQQAQVVLQILLPYPDLERGSEYIVASIAKNWPDLAINFIGDRQKFAKSEDAPLEYDAVPFSVYELKSPLEVVPEKLIAAARHWFDEDEHHFQFDGARLLSSVFPNLENGLDELLADLIVNGDDKDREFVLEVLYAFEGRECVFPIVREVVVTVEAESDILGRAHDVLNVSGVVSGEYGFADLYGARQERLRTWLEDPDVKVQQFAEEHIRNLSARIAAETRSAETDLAMRRLEYGEDYEPDQEN